MEIINGKILLSELAKALNVTSSALIQHLKNNSGLGAGAVKFGGTQTGNYLLSIDSIFQFLNWARSKAKKIDIDTIIKVEAEITWLMKH